MHFRNIAIPLALASPALAGVLAHTTTSTTVSLWVDEPTPLHKPTHEPTAIHEPKEPAPAEEHHKGPPAGPFCPHPKEIDRHWEEESTLNDTTKHHSNFTLFAAPTNPKYSNVRFPVHLKEHPQRKDIWTVNLTMHLPQAKFAEEQQPKWNLKQGGLQTDASAPINDTLYFRLFETSWKRDTRGWAAKKGAMLPVLTTNPNKKTFSYTLSNKKFGPNAGFVVCSRGTYELDSVVGDSGALTEEEKGAAREFWGSDAFDALEKFDRQNAKPSNHEAVVVDIIYADGAKDKPWEDIEGHDHCFPVMLKTEIKNPK
ncbi:hypothetical protein Q7P37_005555 [Cladosporium fusiforme]